MTKKRPGTISRERILLSGRRRCIECGTEISRTSVSGLCRTCKRRRAWLR